MAESTEIVQATLRGVVDKLVPPDQMAVWRGRLLKAQELLDPFQVTDQGTYDRAIAAMGRLREIRKEIATLHDGASAPVRALKAAVQDPLKELIRACDELHGTVRKRAEAWHLAERERARKEQQAAQAAEDAKAAEQGQAAPVVPEVLPPKTSKATTGAQGTMRERWVVEVTSLMELVKAVAEGRADLSLLEPNMRQLRQMRPVKGGQPPQIPGVVYRKEARLAVQA